MKKNQFGIPKTIKIGPFEYSIYLSDNIQLDDRNLSGMVDFDKCEIYIDMNIDEKCKKTTLLHEILHAILHCSSVESDKEDIHKVIDIISIGLLDLLERNKSLLKYLLDSKDR